MRTRYGCVARERHDNAKKMEGGKVRQSEIEHPSSMTEREETEDELLSVTKRVEALDREVGKCVSQVAPREP